ncbi:putative membrane protein [Clostridium bornimense]|uniref:Putative membrane protein n=1 Tax=Clostridium bornimense TaxID=1216932 RepID=W6RUB7_9CLOT|nr:YibE/F family protein [Clostridium bornimense]CDM68221.1 putative membrane protein [Clostridium bornimense]
MSKSILNVIKDYIDNHKKEKIKYLSIIIISLMIISFFYNNYFLYDTEIAKINSIDEVFEGEEKGPDGDIEKNYTQNIIATIKNGDFKGKEVIIKNKYSSSLVYTDKYKINDDVFITKKVDKNGDITGNITGLKRDKYIVITIVIFILLLILVGKQIGGLVLGGLIVNIGVFYIMIHLYSKGINILLLSVLATFIFSTAFLMISSGINRKTFAAITITLVSVAIVTLLSIIILQYTGGLDYEFMEYLPKPYNTLDADYIFISEIMIGGLGAVMDIAITMVTTVNELIDKNPYISKTDLKNSCTEVGNDVMGTMINVLFFTNLAGCIPIFALSIKNGIKLTTLLTTYIPFEIARFLTGSIGIVITIPIATYLSTRTLKRMCNQ